MPTPRYSALRRGLLIALAAIGLSGCVVVPYHPFHPYRPVYYYP